MSQLIRKPSVVIDNTPTLDTNIYADADRLGSIEELEGVALDVGGIAELNDIVCLDGDDQGTAINFLFFDELPTVASADNAALSISDAEMAKCVGIYELAAADFADVVTSKLGQGVFTKLLMKCKARSTSLWVVMQVASGTPTYTAAGMKNKFKFSQH